MKNIDPDSWAYMAYQGVERIARAMSQMSKEELLELKGALNMLSEHVSDRIQNLWWVVENYDETPVASNGENWSQVNPL